MPSLENIDHFVVLMLENRSFDNLFGWLYTPAEKPGFNGLSGRESNPGPDGPIRVWPTPDNPQPPAGALARLSCMPNPDPGEKFEQINQQLFGLHEPGQAPAGPATMSGFAASYSTDDVRGRAQDIMHCFQNGELPALHQLARNYAVCDGWFASAPCQTWPNRFFLHTGTAGGYENNEPCALPFRMPTVFKALEDHLPHGWEVYFHDFPQALTLSDLWDRLDHFRPFSDFLDDARHGNLPSYAFIEPRYFADGDWPNDMHPPHDVSYGDQLVAQVYNALRSSPCWSHTMLIVIFDEHGGCYDHVPPPAAVSPGVTEKWLPEFDFSRYGVRVPAVIASPFIQPGTVFRSDGPYPFDHTSVISTLRKRFGGGPLTARDAAAPDLCMALNLGAPDLSERPAVVAREVLSDPAGLAAASQAPLNDAQQAMYQVMKQLAPLIHGKELSVASLQSLQACAQGEVKAAAQALDAVPFIRSTLARLLS